MWVEEPHGEGKWNLANGMELGFIIGWSLRWGSKNILPTGQSRSSVEIDPLGRSQKLTLVITIITSKWCRELSMGCLRQRKTGSSGWGSEQQLQRGAPQGRA